MTFEVNYKITDTNKWFKAFPPRGAERQWKPNFSAFEFAKAVLSNDFNKEVAQAIGEPSLKLINGKIFPERGTSFDSIPGGTRSHDLACIGKINNKAEVALCFEAKVRESFGSLIKNEKQETDGKKLRVNNLCKTFFGINFDQKEVGEIPYQLLTGLAGTIAFATENNIKNSYFIVYQLYPVNNHDMKEIEDHKNDVNNFLKLFKSSNIELNNKEIKVNCPLDLGTITLYEEGKLQSKGSSHVHIVFMEKPFKISNKDDTQS